MKCKFLVQCFSYADDLLTYGGPTNQHFRLQWYVHRCDAHTREDIMAVGSDFCACNVL